MRSSIAPGWRRPLRAAWTCALLLALPGWASAQASQGVGVRQAAEPVPATGPTPATAAAPASGAAATGSAGSSAQPAPALQQSDPRAVATAVEQANRLLKESKPDDALKVLDVALKASPRDPQLRFLYGVILADRGRVAEAADVFQQLTEDFPELPEPHNNLAVVYAASGDLDKARAALENAVRALPGYALAHENLGDVYLRMAARSYERATKADARSASARDKLALARELVSRVAGPR
jgi:Flp pilus assembly protein TadD